MLRSMARLGKHKMLTKSQWKMYVVKSKGMTRKAAANHVKKMFEGKANAYQEKNASNEMTYAVAKPVVFEDRDSIDHI